MATGIVSGAWGYSPQMIAGMANPAELYNKPLTYQESITSIPPNGTRSPLTLANEKYYSTNFGKKKKMNEITYLKKQLKKR
jgi:hypothetical protein